MQNTPETVYYYCKPHVFESIIKNRKIWLCDMLKTNDYGEIQYILKDIKKRITPDLFLKILTTDEAQIVSGQFCKWCDKALDRCYWLALCLSKTRNGLIHWRTYGDDGRGFSIGFNVEKLKSFSKERGLLAQDIKYRKREKEVHIEKCLRDLVVAIEGNGGAKNLLDKRGNLKESTKDKLRTHFNTILPEIGFFKSEDFMFENEFRLGYAKCFYEQRGTGILVPLGNSKIEGIKYDAKFNEKKNTLIVHREEKISDDLITEILIGPCNNTNRIDVKTFMSENKWDISNVHIEESRITYRG